MNARFSDGSSRAGHSALVVDSPETPMHRPIPLALGAFSLIACAAVAAGPRDEALAHYAAQAQRSTPSFSGFSAERGRLLHTSTFTGGKPDTRACTSCHGEDPRRPGQTRAGKAIDPVAVSVSPQRYTDLAKMEKWFKRNCNEVLGRECTAVEKGDWLSHMVKQ
jgi:hypothetical protein